MSKIKTIFIVGPTASGKTSLSIEIAKKYGGEFESAEIGLKTSDGLSFPSGSVARWYSK